MRPIPVTKPLDLLIPVRKGNKVFKIVAKTIGPVFFYPGFSKKPLVRLKPKTKSPAARNLCGNQSGVASIGARRAAGN